MEKLIQGWFDTSLQGVAFAEPIRNGQGEVTDFRYRLVNAAFANMLRRTKEELIGQVVRKVFQPMQANDFFLPMVTVIQTGDMQQLLKQYLLDGEDVWHDVTLSRIGGLVIINVQDVSEQKKTERDVKLRQKNQELNTFFDVALDLHCILNAEGRFLKANRAWEATLGYSEEELSTLTYLSLIHPDEEESVHFFFNNLFNSQPLRGQINQIRIKDGAYRFLEWNAIGIDNHIYASAKDITERQQTKNQMTILNQLKSQFVTTASHEFRTPLTTIQSSVELIKLYLDLPTANPPIQKHLTVIEKEIDRFNRLLTDILTIGKIESGEVSFSPQWVNIVSVCEEIITTHFSQQAKSRQVRLVIEGAPYRVYLDDKLISHVIVNLLSNAFKFSTDVPCLRILFKTESLVLQIIDGGIGIPERELSTLFQGFFRASNTAGIQGTGLGLIIARQFVELHGGHLDLQSEEKKGTTCTVNLPTRHNEQLPTRFNTALLNQ